MKQLFNWRSRKKRPAAPVAAQKSYHAVTIQFSPASACAAVREMAEQPYLSADAPSLPVPNCSTPGECRCHYRHQQDRRGNLRRDQDHGLPGRFFDGEDRREASKDRRGKRRTH